MSDASPFECPEITDEEICWVSRLLRLPADAFYGKDGTDPRRAVLKSMEPIDVAACPGSGKTTLLVAKLAILAEKWRYRTRGVCVLSHTNVARNEIETRLGNTAAGQRLLSYPHYIGTIHGFLNEFLALPWLRSQGHRIKMIDTEVSLRRRWYALPFATRNVLEKNGHDRSMLSVKSSDFSVGRVRWGKRSVLGTSTPTYRHIQDTCRLSIADGYFCYDEMFVWARELIEKAPGTIEVIRSRFPLLFIDEAQDNGEDQSAILHRLFLEGGSAVVRQRFGDGNQAIFDSITGEAATTDRFPDEIKRDLPNSHRFGPTIADLADPLGLNPYGLEGQGPKHTLASGLPEGRHTIFLFDDDRANRVMDAYAELLIETFSEWELREGTFTAVGQVHRPLSDQRSHKFPHHVGHYWPDYDPELTRRDPKPQTFVQYVFVGMGRAETTGETYLSVEKTAEGILRLARMAEDAKALPARRGSHRYIVELLEECPDASKRYQELVDCVSVKREAPTKETWDGHWCRIVRGIAEAIAGVSLSSSEAGAFLAWQDEPDKTASSSVSRKSRDNIYRYPNDNPKLHIRTGSIHSVKGETHQATLILETFWYKYNLESLIPWLKGEKAGGASESVQRQSRLKLHYVAMTRPTHLLCLAMKLDTFMDGNGSLNQEMIGILEQRGWRVKSI